MVSRCHGWCSVISGRVLTWWTASSHAPPRKPSSPFSWPLPPLSAWSLTWLSLHILLPRLSLGRGINQSDSQVINWNSKSSIFHVGYWNAESPWVHMSHLVFSGVSVVRRRGKHAESRIRQTRSYLSQPEEAAARWAIHAEERFSEDLKIFKA